MFILPFRPLSAMCTDRLELQDCLEHGRTAKVLTVHIMLAHKRVKNVADVITDTNYYIFSL